MISAQSLQRLSNGSRWFLSSLICLFFLSGCSPTTTSTARTEVIKPDIKKPEVKVAPRMSVDTISWTFESEETYPPIIGEGMVASYLLERVEKERYKIALLLPMKIKQDIPTLDANNRKFADFYAGIKMAAQEDFDLKADIQVFYTDRDEIKLDQILQQLDADTPDIIIASFQSDLIIKTANFANERRIPLISPWKSGTKISNNIFYLQMRPSIEHYYSRILDHVDFNFNKEDVRIIQREDGSDRSKTGLIRKLQEESSELPLFTPYETFDVVLDSLMDSEANVFDTALVQGVKAFILPHYNTRDDGFIYSCLRKMYGEKNGRDFHVYTMPVALKSDRVDINILKNLNIRTAEFRYPDLLDQDVQRFRKAFFHSHGWLPTEEAYYGYDLMSFISHGLQNYGQYFHYFMAGEDLQLMQMKVHIQPFYKDKDNDRPDLMVNDYLYIIEYVDDHFEIKDIR